jgi:hypothetical protein
VEQFFYYRSLSKSADIWRKGKKIKTFPLDVEKQTYLSHLTTGKGFPSIWMSSNNEDLEKIALGLMLCKGSLDRIEFIGLHPCCFEKTQVKIIQAPSPQFPLPSVANLHYELQTYNDENLTDSVEIFLHCNGKIEKFPKVSNSETETSMLNIAKKYIDEISGEAYIKKARDWIEKYGKSQVTGN